MSTSSLFKQASPFNGSTSVTQEEPPASFIHLNDITIDDYSCEKLFSLVDKISKQIYLIKNQDELNYYKDRIVKLQGAFNRNWKKLQEKPTSAYQKVLNIWGYFFSTPDLSEQFQVRLNLVSDALTRVDILTILEERFLQIQELGIEITKLRNLETACLLEAKLEALSVGLEFLKEVLALTSESNRKDQLIENIYDFFLSYTDTDPTNSQLAQRYEKNRIDFEYVVRRFLIIMNFEKAGSFKISLDPKIKEDTLKIYNKGGIDALLDPCYLQQYNNNNLCSIVKILFKKMLVGKIKISLENLPLLTVLLLFTYRFKDYKIARKTSFEAAFLSINPIFRKLSSLVNLFIEEMEYNPVYKAFLERHFIQGQKIELLILQWLFFSEDKDRCTEDERHLINHLDPDRYKTLYFLKEQMAPYLQRTI